MNSDARKSRFVQDPRESDADQVDPLADLSVIYFGNDWFAENRTSSHHIARQVAQEMPLLYIDTPGMRSPRMRIRDLRKVFRIMRAWLANPEQLGQQFWHLTVPQFPLRRIPLVQKLNRIIGRWSVRRAVRFLNFGRRLSWFTVPHPAEMAGTVGDEFIVYYAVDDYAALAQVDRDRIRQFDDVLTSRADLVFVTSQSLFDEKRSLNRNLNYSPHGVDFELFCKAEDPDTPVPDGARGLRRPVIGYYGSIAGQMDLELVAYLAGQRSNWTFLLIGLVSVDPAILRGLPNIHLVGPQPYQSLPGWAKAFDVAIVPYRRDRFVLRSNPLKIREYLATGKPVVSIRTPEIERFAEFILLADSNEEFLHKIDQALTGDSSELRQARMNSVRNCSWEARAESALRRVRRALTDRCSQDAR